MSRYHFKRFSLNSKLGGLPAVMSSADTCPPSCPLRGKGCYAESGRIRLHWKRLTRAGIRKVCENVRRLPFGALWRFAVAGDLPGKGGRISAPELRALVQANRGRKGFAYTHKPLSKRNLELMREAHSRGFTVNLSTEGLRKADAISGHGLPVVTVLPDGFKRGNRTPAGIPVIACPEQTTPGMDCAHCAICQRPERNFIVGFYPHGRAARKVRAIATRADTR